MKEQKWDDSIESERDFVEAALTLPDEESLGEKELVSAAPTKSHMTDLRRRIEERLDSKKIAFEFDDDHLDELLEGMQ